MTAHRERGCDFWGCVRSPVVSRSLEKHGLDHVKGIDHHYRSVEIQENPVFSSCPTSRRDILACLRARFRCGGAFSSPLVASCGPSGTPLRMCPESASKQRVAPTASLRSRL